MAIQTEAHEKRVGPRVQSRLPVQFKAGTVSGQTVTSDISESGLYILTDEDPPLGARVHVHVELGTTQPVRILGEVVRKASMPGLGIGVRFDSMTQADKTRLSEFVLQESSRRRASRNIKRPQSPAQRILATGPRTNPASAPVENAIAIERPVSPSHPAQLVPAVETLLYFAKALLYVAVPLLVLLLIGLGIGKFIDSLRSAI